MKKIFTLFAALAMVMSMSAKPYLRGDFNGWGTGNEFINNVCTIPLSANTKYEFKVDNNGDWNTSYGGATITESKCTDISCSGSGNATITTTKAGQYVFTWNASAKKISVAYPKEELPKKDITVKAKMPAHWTNTITAWVWTVEDGNGKAVTPTQEGDWYVVTQNTAVSYIIFRNGTDWTGDNNQTVDLQFSDNACIQLSQTGNAKATHTLVDCEDVTPEPDPDPTPDPEPEPEPDPTPGETKDITVKAQVPATWTNTITAWVWYVGQSGKEVVPTKEGNWYVVTENCTELNVIFKNGEGWNGDANQTVDMKFTENTCISITAGVGKAAYTVVDCEGGVTPEPEPEPDPTPAAYYVVGTFNAWTNPDPTYAMTEEGGVYTKTLALEAGDYMLKVTNGTWEDGGNWGYDALAEVPAGVTRNNDGNIVFTLAEAGDVVVTFNGTNVTVAGNFSISTEPATVKYVLMGVAGDWETGIELTLNESNTEYTEYMLLAQPIAEGDAVKVVTLINGTATYCGTVEEGSAEVTFDDRGNIVLAPGTYDFYYKPEADIIYIGAVADPTPDPEPDPTPDAYYVVGTFNGWTNPDPEYAMTAEGDLYTITLTLETGLHKLKVTNGTWEDGGCWGYAALAEVPEGVTSDADGNIGFTLAEAGDVVVTFNGTNVTVAGNFSISTEPTTVKYVLMGVAGDWTTGIELTLNVDNTEFTEYMLLAQPIAEGDAVKVVTLINGTATYCGTVEEGSAEVTFDDRGNIVLAPGTYDFYYKPEADIIYIGVTPDGPTALDNIDTTIAPAKLIENGQFFIIRNGVKYNANGAIVK